MNITIEFRSGRVRCYSNATLDTNKRIVVVYSDDNNTVIIIPFEAIEVLGIETEKEEQKEGGDA